jgi:Tol biopolymer transport system component
MRADGSNVVQLTTGPNFLSLDRQPDISPDGSQVAFTRVSTLAGISTG